MISCAWLWVYVGAALILMELITPGFVICFFGLSAMTVGGMRFLLGDMFTLTWQVAAFSVFAIVYIILLRRYLKKIFVGGVVNDGTNFDNQYVGKLGRITQSITPPATGRVMIGDSEWTAQADEALAVDTMVKVVSQNNLTMKVEEVK